jgi:hypothetical protein
MLALAVILMYCLWAVLSSNPGRGSGNSQSVKAKVGEVSRLSHNLLLSNPFNSAFIYHSTARRYIVQLLTSQIPPPPPLPTLGLNVGYVLTSAEMSSSRTSGYVLKSILRSCACAVVPLLGTAQYTSGKTMGCNVLRQAFKTGQRIKKSFYTY